MAKFRGFLNLEVSQIQVLPFEHPVREMNDLEYQKLKESVQREGVLNPVIIGFFNKQYYLIDGRHRVKVCRELGINEVPSYILEIDSKEELELYIKVLEGIRKQLSETEFERIVSTISEIRFQIENKKEQVHQVLDRKDANTKKDEEKELILKEKKEFYEERHLQLEEELNQAKKRIQELLELLREKDEQLKELEFEKEEAIYSAIKEKEEGEGVEITESEKERIEKEVAQKYEEQIRLLYKEKKELIEQVDSVNRKLNDLMVQKNQIEKAVKKAHEDIKKLISVGRLSSIFEEIYQLLSSINSMFEKIIYYGYTFKEEEYKDLQKKWENNVMLQVMKIDHVIKELSQDTFIVEKKEASFEEAVKEAEEKEFRERARKLFGNQK